MVDIEEAWTELKTEEDAACKKAINSEEHGGNMVDFISRVKEEEEMKDLSIDDSLYIGGKKYHIQTNSSGESRKIVSILFIDGKVLDSSIFVYGPDLSEGALTRLVRSVHNKKVAEMKSLFQIAEKLTERKHTEPLSKLGCVFLGKRMYEEAIRQFTRALKMDPDYAEAQNNVGLALSLAGRDREALEFYQKAIENQPNYGDFHNNLGVVLCKIGRHKEGIEELQKAVRLGAKYGEAYFNLGLAHLKVVQDPISVTKFPPASVLVHRALENFEKAIDLTPHFKDKYFQSGLLHLKNNMIGKAIEDFSRSLMEVNKLKAKQREICYEFYLRFLYQDKGITEPEIKEYILKLQNLLSKRPDYADLHNYIAGAYLIWARTLFQKASDHLQHSLSINPNFRKAQDNLKLVENESKGLVRLLWAIFK